MVPFLGRADVSVILTYLHRIWGSEFHPKFSSISQTSYLKFIWLWSIEVPSISAALLIEWNIKIHYIDNNTGYQSANTSMCCGKSLQPQILTILLTLWKAALTCKNAKSLDYIINLITSNRLLPHSSLVETFFIHSHDPPKKINMINNHLIFSVCLANLASDFILFCQEADIYFFLTCL